MPIEIRELHIKVNVEEDPPERSVTPRRSSASSDRDTVINACVEKVLEVLKQEDRR